MLRIALLATATLVAGCGILPITVADTARLAPGQFGTSLDPDVPAVYLAQWAFADPARTAGHPIEGARAVAAMDYVAGELNTSPRWANIPATVQLQLLRGRADVRRVIGVAPGASSQAVVDQLTIAADALAHADESAALRQLGAPTFDVPARTVLARLTNLPYVPEANYATMRAANSLFRPDGNDWN